MKKIFYSFLFAIFLTPVIAADCPKLKDKNTLQDILEIGLCRNPQTKMSYLSVESARLAKNSAYSGYLPSVKASASTSANSTSDFNDWGKGASISASYLIFDFGRRESDLMRLAAIWKATGFDYQEDIQNYVYGVIGAYYGLLSANADVTTSTDLVKVAQEAYDTANKKFTAGVVPKADVLRADTQLTSKKTDLQRSKGNLEIAVAKLLTMLSLPLDSKIEITDMPASFGSAAESKSIEELLKTAEKNRPDLMAANANVDAAWHARNATFMRHLPTISASGGYSYDFDTKMNSTNIGLSVSMPIFSGFADVYSDRIATINYERAKESERQARENMKLDVWSAFQNYKTAREVLDSTKTQLKSAIESEKITAGMYKVGRSTMLDWQTALADLASAKQQNSNAKYDLFIKRAALAMAVGDLKAK